MAKATGATDA
jgi:hypothetical protein